MLVVKTFLTLVFARIRYAQRVEIFRNSYNAFTLNKPFENRSDNFCSLVINYQFMVVIRVFQIAVSGERTDKFALLSVDVKRPANADGSVGNVAFVYNILNADSNALSGRVSVLTNCVNAAV